MRLARLTLAFAIALSGCGTHDYKDRPTDKPQKSDEKTTQSLPQTKKRGAGSGSSSSFMPSLFRGYAKEGFAWEWAENEPWAERLKCEVRDGEHVDYWTVFGYQVFGGALLGVIYKASGGFWLGRPSNEPDKFTAVPVPTPAPAAWAWQRIYLDSQRLKAGLARGVAWTTGCANILGPGYLLPINGVLGTDFRSISTSIALGIAAAVATKPYMNYFMRGGFKRGETESASSLTSHVVGLLSKRFSFAGKRSFIGRTVAPNLVVIFVGAGVALIVDRSLQQPNPNLPAPEDVDCAAPAQTPNQPENGVTQ